MGTDKDNAFSGLWSCTHWYPSKDDTGQDISVHTMQAHQIGSDVVLQSVPTEKESYMLIRLTIDGEIATGTWHESTLHDGNFKGAQYSGAGQLVISEDKTRMEGEWAGAGFDHALNKMRIYTDKWEIVRAEKKA